MELWISLALIVLTAILLYSCHKITPMDTSRYRSGLLQKMDDARTFEDFTNALFCYEVTSDSVTTAYTLKHPENYNIPTLPSCLTSFSYQQYEKDRETHAPEKLLTRLSKQLSIYDTAALSKSDQLTKDLLQSHFDLSKQLCAFSYYEDLLGATTGVAANLPVTLGEYPLRNEKDVKTYLTLLTQIPSYFDDVILYETHRNGMGIATPDFLLLDSADGLSSLIKDLKQTENCFTEPFRQRLSSLSGLSDRQRSDYEKTNREYVNRYVLPAYQKLSGFVTQQIHTEPDKTTSLSGSSSRNRQYLPDTDTAYGLSSLPDGADYYTLLVKNNTGSGHTLPELISMTELALKAALRNVQTVVVEDPDAYLYYCDHPAASYYENPDTTLEALSLMIRENYPLLEATPSYTVKTVPKSLEQHVSPAFYMIPAIDDFENHTIYINSLYTNTENGNLFSTLAHEGFPGHLYQTVFFNSTHPNAIRQILDYPGYVEGWATYVEMNSFHNMDYPMDGDSLCTLYQSDTIISLALSSRVDLGVNYENWTLSDTCHFFEQNGFKDYYAADVYAYVVEAPAAYLRYFIGYLEIEQLKSDYKNQKMEDFSELDFHRTFLEIGPADFDTIRRVMELD